MDRRSFLKGTATVVPATVGLQMLTTRFAWAQSSDFGSDEDVLNYALTLEFLESEFYRQGNDAGLLSGKEAEYVQTIGADEDAHVAALTDTIMKIGGTPVKAPAVDFGKSFASRESYLKTAHVFENTGVGAYLGAAGFIKNKDILQAAAGIFGVEARHAAVVGSILGLSPEDGVYMGATETPQDMNQVLGAVQPFLAGSSSMSGGAAVTR
ncbi:MAG: ferritin-like domain-containing protein [Actinomycetota bacterium]